MNENILAFPVERDFALKKRVVVYARVSTRTSEQESSYDNQVNELIKLVKANPSYELVCVFADKESGRSSNRKSFLQMIELVRSGSVDLVITKAISRFGRNLVDVVSLIREFKTYGCDIYFEKENLWTHDANIELTLNILSAAAEEESRQVSSNTAWSFTKKMRSGGNTTHKIYGYSIEGDRYTIVPEQAIIVRQIFEWYVGGVTYASMIENLETMGVYSPSGNPRWYQTTIEDMLVNEKYIGDMLLRKFRHGRPRSSFVANAKGQVEQFYVRDHHEGIISKSLFDAAQELRKTRKAYYNALGSQATRNPYTRYFYCKGLGRFFSYVVERTKGKYEIPTLRAVRKKERQTFRFMDIQKGIMLAADYLVNNDSIFIDTVMKHAPGEMRLLRKHLGELYADLSVIPIEQ